MPAPSWSVLDRKPGPWLFWGPVLLIGCCFAFKALAAIPLTSLWNDELRTVEKAFQPSLAFLFRYLQRDVHPPLYYLLLWGGGKLFGETVVVLRGFSWVCYAIGALALALACWSWRPSHLAAGLAVLLGLSLPFTVRFAVEGKAYALLYALISLALLCRLRQLQGQSQAGLASGVFWAAAALTHYYGMGLLLAQTLLDGWRRRPTWKPQAWALVLPTLWMLLNIGYLLGPGGRQWIQPTSATLLFKALRLGLGPQWPAILLVAGAALVVLWLTGTAASRRPAGLLADWGLDAALLLMAGSLLVSLFKPSAVDRYFIVLVPASVGVLACWLGLQMSDGPPGRWRGGVVAGLLSFLLVLFWTDAYRAIAPAGAAGGARKANDFRSLALLAADSPLKFSPQCRQLNAYDHVLEAEGWIRPASPWGCWSAPAGGAFPELTTGRSADGDRSPLSAQTPGEVITLAVTGRKTPAASGWDAMVAALTSQGYVCSRDPQATRLAQVVRCRFRDQS